MNNTHVSFTLTLCLVAGLAGTRPSFSQTPSKRVARDEEVLDQQSADIAFKKRPATLPPGPAYPSRPFFGDTHLHTSQSLDAVMFGNSLGPEEAYRFAQ